MEDKLNSDRENRKQGYEDFIDVIFIATILDYLQTNPRNSFTTAKLEIFRAIKSDFNLKKACMDFIDVIVKDIIQESKQERNNWGYKLAGTKISLASAETEPLSDEDLKQECKNLIIEAIEIAFDNTNQSFEKDSQLTTKLRSSADNLLVDEELNQVIEKGASLWLIELEKELSAHKRVMFILKIKKRYKSDIKEVNRFLKKKYHIAIKMEEFWSFINNKYNHSVPLVPLITGREEFIKECASNKYNYFNDYYKLDNELKDQIIDASIVDRLFSKYGTQFPDESLEAWQMRFSGENIKYGQKLNIKGDIKGFTENNRLLIYTILKEIEDFLIKNHKLPEHFNQWASNRFGFDYQSAKSRNKRDDKIHSEAHTIRNLLELKKEFDSL